MFSKWERQKKNSGKTGVNCPNGVYSPKTKHKKTISIDLIMPISTVREIKH